VLSRRWQPDRQPQEEYVDPALVTWGCVGEAAVREAEALEARMREAEARYKASLPVVPDPNA
jgi:hypothetical protein